MYSACVSLGLGCLTIPSLWILRSIPPLLLFGPSPHLTLNPSLAFDPVHSSIPLRVLPPLFLPPPPPRAFAPLFPPQGRNTNPVFTMMATRRSSYQIRPPPKEVFPESTLSPGGLQLTTLFWDTGILFHQGSHAGARVGNNFEVFGCIVTRVSISPVVDFDGLPC